jgi:hypothetical protein
VTTGFAAAATVVVVVVAATVVVGAAVVDADEGKTTHLRLFATLAQTSFLLATLTI